MKLGVHNEALADSLQEADLIWMYRPDDMGEGFDASLEQLGGKLSVHKDYDQLVNDMSRKVLSGDQIIFMSNGGFGSARQTLTALLQRTRGS
jgi:UDP-N-acetylmuramate: L-alanyl-gamma-D-glutamyl-meso-diaminopimelate ligase